jgi:hypothetical protein
MRAERLLTMSESPHVQANLPGIVLKDTEKCFMVFTAQIFSECNITSNQLQSISYAESLLMSNQGTVRKS